MNKLGFLMHKMRLVHQLRDSQLIPKNFFYGFEFHIFLTLRWCYYTSFAVFVPGIDRKNLLPRTVIQLKAHIRKVFQIVCHSHQFPCPLVFARHCKGRSFVTGPWPGIPTCSHKRYKRNFVKAVFGPLFENGRLYFIFKRI